MHIYDKYTGCVECYTGCNNKKIFNKRYAKSLLCYYHCESAFYIISCMRDTVVLKLKQNESFKNILQSSLTG